MDNPTTLTTKTLTTKKFSIFNDEVIDRYFNDAGKAAIQQYVLANNPILNKLKAIKQEAYAEDFDTYDYNIIAERVLELLGEYEEKDNG